MFPQVSCNYFVCFVQMSPQLLGHRFNVREFVSRNTPWHMKNQYIFPSVWAEIEPLSVLLAGGLRHFTGNT